MEEQQKYDIDRVSLIVAFVDNKNWKDKYFKRNTKWLPQKIYFLNDTKTPRISGQSWLIFSVEPGWHMLHQEINS